MRKSLTFVLMACFISSCSSLGIVVSNGGNPPPRSGGGGPRSYESYRTLNIPPGHLPPPGECRIWYPGTPPGQQPPPTSCDEAFRKAGIDAWVITRADDDPKILEVREKKKKGVSVEVVINYYKID